MNARLSGRTILGLPLEHGGVVVADDDRVVVGPSILVGPSGSAVIFNRLFPHTDRPRVDLDTGTGDLLDLFLDEGLLDGLQALAGLSVEPEPSPMAVEHCEAEES